MTDLPRIVLEPGAPAVRLEFIPTQIAYAKRPAKPDEDNAYALARATDKERQQADLTEAIQNGSLQAVDVNLNSLDGNDRLFLNLGQLLVETYMNYGKSRGVSVELEATTSVAEIIRETADGAVDSNRKRWEKEGHNNDLRRDLAISFEEASLVNRLKNLVEAGKVVPRNPNDGSPIAGINDFRFACDGPANVRDQGCAAHGRARRMAGNRLPQVKQINGAETAHGLRPDKIREVENARGKRVGVQLHETKVAERFNV